MGTIPKKMPKKPKKKKAPKKNVKPVCLASLPKWVLDRRDGFDLIFGLMQDLDPGRIIRDLNKKWVAVVGDFEDIVAADTKKDFMSLLTVIDEDGFGFGDSDSTHFVHGPDGYYQPFFQRTCVDLDKSGA
jgi:hypothetical protein